VRISLDSLASAAAPDVFIQLWARSERGLCVIEGCKIMELPGEGSHEWGMECDGREMGCAADY
jgi:hypothetical protein